jgi:hypothetical protein
LKSETKAPQLQHGNSQVIQHLAPGESIMAIHQVADVEVDEMGSFVGKKPQQRWLWQAIAHRTGMV